MKSAIINIAIRAAIRSFESKGEFSLGKLVFEHKGHKFNIEGLLVEAHGDLKEASVKLAGVINAKKVRNIKDVLANLDIEGGSGNDDSSIVVKIDKLSVSGKGGKMELADLGLEGWYEIKELAWGVKSSLEANKEVEELPEPDRDEQLSDALRGDNGFI
jgi:hypothetical protein